MSIMTSLLGRWRKFEDVDIERNAQLAPFFPHGEANEANDSCMLAKMDEDEQGVQEIPIINVFQSTR